MTPRPELREHSALPFALLPGIDPSWSRFVQAPDGDGVPRTWHLLDNGAEPVRGTLLCVHGNPTWSYLWRRLLGSPPEGWRVLAVDQLGMGFSERPAAPRRLADRIADLGALTDALGVAGPAVPVAHDWGGPIAVGWALAHRTQIAGLVLTNTAVYSPMGAAAPGPIRLARSRPLRELTCVRTPVFVRGATALSRPPLPGTVRDAFARPYLDAASRQAVGDFVADIPVEPDHPSRPTLDAVAAGLRTLSDVPSLIVWGARDPVFSGRYLDDLLQRLPQADAQRYPQASHLVLEDAPSGVDDIVCWVEGLHGLEGPGGPKRPERRPCPAAPAPARPAWARLVEHGNDEAPAIVELSGTGARTTSFAELNRRVRNLAAGLQLVGVRPGSRVALLVPPGVDLTVAVYACWRLGAVVVAADAGLGLRGLAAALRSAGPDWLVGVPRALAAAAALRIPGRRISVGSAVAGRLAARVGLVATPLAGSRRLGRAVLTLADLERRGRGQEPPVAPVADADAAVLFTSGATGPAKGVVYRSNALAEQLQRFAETCGLGSTDRLVAAFAPFALYGPALGIGVAVPEMDVTAPGTLTAVALARAVAVLEATVVFAAPAALRNVVATAADLDDAARSALRGVRRVLSAGAPVSLALLEAVSALVPNAELHTPYGMTEVLPVTDIDLTGIHAAGTGNGVCVGRPVRGVAVRVSPLEECGRADGALTDEPEVTGEICVAAAHLMDRYDRLWRTERQSSRNPGWHRTGDVGHLDCSGRLWVEGRLAHVIATADGPVTPVGVEQSVEALPSVSGAAAVGVGPVGTQQVVLVVVPAARTDGPLADLNLTSEVRAAAGIDVAAVLCTPRLPVDIRHQSKIDRTRLAAWADRVLRGERPRRP